MLPALAAPAGAAPSDAQRLAERHAPVLQLKQQTDPPCDADGEQYVPWAVEIVLGRPQIVLRAPSSVGEEPAPAPAPTAADLYGRGPAGRSTTPAPPPTRAAPTRDAIALGQGDPPVAYPPVVTQPGVPGRIALQYWFSTTSTSSPTGTTTSSSGTAPTRSSIPRRGRTPTTTRRSSGSGAAPARASAATDTTGPSRRVVPGPPPPGARAVRAGDPYAWLAVEGNWGQKARGLFNAPSGPNTNKKWARPLDWDERLRDTSIAVPGDETLGISVTGFFCAAVAEGSRPYAGLLDSPLAAGLVLLAVGLTIAGTARLTRWSPVELEPIVAPRAGGSRGTFTIPIALLVGGAGSLVAYVIMTAATAEAMRRTEAGRPIGAMDAYRALLPRWKALLGALARAGGTVVLLFLTIVGIPWAVRQAVRWVFIPQVVVFEGLRARDALQRSAELVRGRWWRTAVLVGLLTGIGLATGLLAGLLLLFLTTAPLSVVNFIGSLVYVVALPYVAVALALAYGDRVARGPAPPGGAAVVEANWPFVAFRGGAAAG